MISTYLRLDLYKKVNKEKFFKYIDSCDLSLGEEILSILEGYLEFHYAELALCSGPTWRSGKEMPEYFVSAFRKALLKGKENFEWIVCEKKPTYVEEGNLSCLK